MSRRSDAAAVERLRTRTATWEDRHDEVLVGLLALARDADRLVPVATRPAPPRRRTRPALAGLATSALAGVALVLTGTTTGTAPVAPTPTPATDVAAVTQLFDQVRADLSQADATGSTTVRTRLLARAAKRLAQARTRTTALPVAQRPPLASEAAVLERRIARERAPRPSDTAPQPGTRTVEAPPSPPAGGTPTRPTEPQQPPPSPSPRPTWDGSGQRPGPGGMPPPPQ